MRTLQLFAAILQFGILPTCLAGCYYPGGKEATDDLPCDPNAEVSVCCAGSVVLGFVCLSNKLCVSPKGRIARGSCTDPTWQSPGCPKFCLSDRGIGKGFDVISCSNVTQKETSFCCDGEDNCCDTGLSRFELNPSQPIYTWALYDTTKDAYIVQTPLSTPAPFSASVASASTTSDSATSSGGTSPTKTAESSQGTIGSSLTTGSSPTSDSSPSTAASKAPTETGTQGQLSTEQSSRLSTATQAGIGVGAAAGAILVAAVAYLWWRLRKTQAAVAAAAARQGGWPEGYPPARPAPAYYFQNPAMKYELQGDRQTYELQGQSYYIRGNAGSTELSAEPPYSTVESPVTTYRAIAR